MKFRDPPSLVAMVTNWYHSQWSASVKDGIVFTRAYRCENDREFHSQCDFSRWPH